MDYFVLAKSSFFISPGSHCCKCPKRSNILLQQGKIDALTAKRLIARDLIFNKHMKNVEEPTFSKQRHRGPIDHFLITLPKKKLSKMDKWWPTRTHIRGRHVVSAALNVTDPTAPAPQG